MDIENLAQRCSLNQLAFCEALIVLRGQNLAEVISCGLEVRRVTRKPSRGYDRFDSVHGIIVASSAGPIQVLACTRIAHLHLVRSMARVSQIGSEIQYCVRHMSNKITVPKKI